MAPPALLTRLVLLITLLVGVLAAEHAAPDTSTPKRQNGNYPSVFVGGFNVWLALSSTQNKPLSTTGTAENPFDPARVYLSPNRTHAVVWQYTPEQEHKIYYIKSSPPDQIQPKLWSRQELKPGDRVRVDRPRLFDLTTQKEVPTSDTLFNNPYHEGIMDLQWSPDGREYRFRYNERGHKHLRVLGMNINGTVRAIVDESSNTFIDYTYKTDLRILEATNELIWMSERDGWNHLYLYNLATGTVKNQITNGTFVVNGIVRIDTTARRIWFKAFGIVPGQDPYYAHLARVNFDGTGLKVLTSGGGNDGNGTHTWTFSDENNSFIDRFSRVDMPEASVIRNLETGAVIGVGTNPSPPDPATLNVEIFVAPGRDGRTPIHGIIVKPRNFDPAKKYPIIEHVYNGPTAFFTPKRWNDLGDLPDWAGTDFVVVKLDAMGTNWRHKAFHDVAHKNLGEGGFPDRILWIQAAAASRPWMDVTRVAALGGSAGGQNSLAALLWFGGFYKAAMSDSGCHDNRMDKLWWNEAWMGADLTEPHWAASSNVVNAHRLEGKLLLIVGEDDDNVDPSSTLQVVNALNNAGKDYDLIVMPNTGHGAGFTGYGIMRTKAFFKKHLGATA